MSDNSCALFYLTIWQPHYYDTLSSLRIYIKLFFRCLRNFPERIPSATTACWFISFRIVNTYIHKKLTFERKNSDGKNNFLIRFNFDILTWKIYGKLNDQGKKKKEFYLKINCYKTISFSGYVKNSVTLLKQYYRASVTDE